jgi:phosphatidylserine decarboxylase
MSQPAAASVLPRLCMLTGLQGLLSMVNDAYRFLIPLLLLAALAYFSPIPWLAAPFAVLAAFVAYFFRNPGRQIPQGEGLVLSPADGKVVKIMPLTEGEFAGGSAISIFLNVFNVHVQRTPIPGVLESVEYKRGKFVAAYEDEASRINEQNILSVRGDRIKVVFKQIAGLIARRVVCWKKPGTGLSKGELVGLIRFGSRVDVIVPAPVRIRVKIGEKVKGGSSILGEY